MKPLYLHLGLVTVLVTVLSAGFALSFFHSSDNSYVNTTGTVTFISIGRRGGLFGIIGDDGVEYNPVNLGDEFKVDGLRVQFEASVHWGPSVWWGHPARIFAIEVELV